MDAASKIQRDILDMGGSLSPEIPGFQVQQQGDTERQNVGQPAKVMTNVLVADSLRKGHTNLPHAGHGTIRTLCRNIKYPSILNGPKSR